MKITNASVFSISVPKKSAFAVAYAVRVAAESLIVKLETDTGLIGFGEAVPVKEVTGEDKNQVYIKLKEFCSLLNGCDLSEHPAIMLKAESFLKDMPSACSALDSAFWDLTGQTQNKPLYQIWGGAKEYCLASQSLGILSLEETLSETKKYVEQGITHLKYKIGLDKEADLKRIKQVRDQFPNITIYLDANQGYSVHEAMFVTESLADYKIEFMEQPVAKEDLKGLITVARHSPFAIVADEAIQGMESLDKLLALGTIPMINIKLMKCGGPSKALKMIQKANEYNIKCMIGCMIETRLGITTGLHVAQASNNVYYIDLDGCWDLNFDIVKKDGANLHDGKEFVSLAPGLGVCIDEELLRKFSDK